MISNHDLIVRFYGAFQKKDYAAMQSCYCDNATFSDPVFQNLDSEQVKAMWEMLCKRGKELGITFSVISADEGSAVADWTARYTFSATGRKVVNHVHATFVTREGKIVSHTDRFGFYKWSSQALGLTGLLLGWTPLVRKKVQKTAMHNLEEFMKTRNY
jgi:ketosteroid isomerase-like protein